MSYDRNTIIFKSTHNFFNIFLRGRREGTKKRKSSISLKKLSEKDDFCVILSQKKLRVTKSNWERKPNF